jgi:hypothetical protein
MRVSSSHTQKLPVAAAYLAGSRWRDCLHPARSEMRKSLPEGLTFARSLADVHLVVVV